MKDLNCSLPGCEDELLGSAVMLADDLEWGIDWEAGGYETYAHIEAPTPLIVLHPTCFMKLFDELLRGEKQTVLRFILGPIGEIKGALALEGG